MIEATDLIGRTIHPGDYVTWATSGGSSSPRMSIGEILTINYKRATPGGYGSKEKCEKKDATSYTLTMRPCYGLGTGYGYGHATKEVPDPNFYVEEKVWDPVTGRYNPGPVTFPGVKQVYDPDGKNRKVTLQNVENVVLLDKDIVLWAEQREIQKNHDRVTGYR